MESIMTAIIEGLIRGWKSQNRLLKRTIVGVFAATIIGVAVLFFGEIYLTDVQFKIAQIVAFTLLGFAFITSFVISVYQDLLKKEKQTERIEILEEELKSNPKETLSAWELAKLNLQGYLDRNLRQVSAIFYLSVFVMLIGFGLIIYGVYRAFENPEMLNPSILVSCSGLIVNFIGATFLIIYRSTINQAKNYVEVLERINAVGMSIQILESLDDDQNELKQNTTAEIAKELLNIYSQKKSNEKLANYQP